MVAEHITELVAEPRIIHRRADRGVPGPLVLQCVLQQSREVEAPRGDPEGLAEAVSAPAAPVNPGQPVEQQPVAATRGQPPQLGAGAVDQDGPQPANFAVRPVRMRHKCPRHYYRAAARIPTEGVSPFPWLLRMTQVNGLPRVICCGPAPLAGAAFSVLPRGAGRRQTVVARSSAPLPSSSTDARRSSARARRSRTARGAPGAVWWRRPRRSPALPARPAQHPATRTRLVGSGRA